MSAAHKKPALHNAMWPGLVGKGPDSEPPIDLDTMLNLTAAAEVDGQRFDGVDLFLSLPWLFLLLAVRALLPLNASPVTSVAITFLLLGCLGWAAPARIIRAGTRTLVNSDYLVQASANGISRWRLFWRHLLPNLRPILLAQFWLSVPLFILSEANLGLLGLGVSEPLPSWGAMLRELENYSAVLKNPWMLAPAVLLVVIVSCLQLLLRTEEGAPC